MLKCLQVINERFTVYKIESHVFTHYKLSARQRNEYAILY